ncbi:MAG: nucleoside hydrolase, partial [Bacilli bacterium]
MKIPIIIDTDPGVDDTVAIICALANEQIDVKLISTVSGNVNIGHTTQNALNLVNFLEKDIKVVQGSNQPLIAKPVYAKHVHGSNGINDYQYKNQVSLKDISKNFLLEMYQTIKSNENEIILVTLGPLTNIAMLFMEYPQVITMIKEIYIMGGGIKNGNVTK